MWNPMQLIGMLKSGGDPRQVIQQIAMSNLQVRQVMNMTQGKSPDELRKMAENVCRERGTTPEQIMQMLGMN